MNETKMNYDEEADVLYLSFGRSEHVTGVELTDNIILRLDTGQATEMPPRAVGLTFISFSYLLKQYPTKPLHIPLTNRIPMDLWHTVLSVITVPPVSDFLSVGLSILPQIPLLPKQLQTTTITELVVSA